MVVDSTAAVGDITSLINTVLVVTIPSIIGMVTGILSIINHKSNSARIHAITDKVGAYAAKVDNTAEILAKHEDQITAGLTVATDLSPDLKKAIVDSNPTVQTIQARQQEIQNKIDELAAYVKSVGAVIDTSSSTAATTASQAQPRTAGTKPQGSPTL